MEYIFLGVAFVLIMVSNFQYYHSSSSRYGVTFFTAFIAVFIAFVFEFDIQAAFLASIAFFFVIFLVSAGSAALCENIYLSNYEDDRRGHISSSIAFYVMILIFASEKYFVWHTVFATA